MNKNNCKRNELAYICTGQVLHDQLPLNSPGSEGSKGRWLSGAWAACPFFIIFMVYYATISRHRKFKSNQKAQSLGILDGITTNPSLMYKEGIAKKYIKSLS